LREIWRLCACSSGYMVTYTKHIWTDINSLQFDEREGLDRRPEPVTAESNLAPYAELRDPPEFAVEGLPW
jgi:hypothetical protein